MAISLIGFTALLSACVSSSNNTRIAKPLIPETRLEGSVQEFPGGKISSWTILGGDGKIRLIGLNVPMGVLNSFLDSKNSSKIARFKLPDAVMEENFIDHIDVQFLPKGLGNLSQPSLALRFIGMDENQQVGIDCRSTDEPDLGLVPDGYEFGECEAQFGIRLMPIEIQEDLDHPTSFVQTNLSFHNENIVVIEPVVSIEKLFKKESFTIYMPTLEMSQGVSYPTTFTGVYEPSSDSYDFSMWSFAQLEE